MWDNNDTTTEMTSYKNDTIVDTDVNQSEVETDQNHTYVDISAFELENTLYPYSTNEWKEFIGDLDFDDIVTNVANAKPQK